MRLVAVGEGLGRLDGRAVALWLIMSHVVFKFQRSYRSPFYQVADILKDVLVENLETINPFVLTPWEERVDTTVNKTATPVHRSFSPNRGRS